MKISVEHMDELLKNDAFVDVHNNEESLAIPYIQERDVSKYSQRKFRV